MVPAIEPPPVAVQLPSVPLVATVLLPLVQILVVVVVFVGLGTTVKFKVAEHTPVAL